MGLYGYIWSISSRAQILLALLSALAAQLDLVPIELQRRIVNDAIEQRLFASLAWMCGVYGDRTGPPKCCLPPVDFCRGVRPTHAANSRALRNAAGSATVAAMAVAMRGPIPGIAARR
jgi:hypothetical protein